MTSTPLTFARAKRMRREPTEAENKLWGGLRDRRLGGLKFVRQVPIGPYIVDFLNRELRLVVEVDGDTHGDDAQIAYDEKRTRFLEAKRLRVVRVYNADIFRNVSEVLDGIYLFAMERGG
jgi:very-short-patch-repair endonuclease